MTATLSPFDRLARWYAAQCNGDWEHSFGISLETLDNPGWLLKINLMDTPLENVTFDIRKIGNMEDTWPEPDFSHWIICKVENHVFDGACSPFALAEMITIFVDWAEAASAASPPR